MSTSPETASVARTRIAHLALAVAASSLLLLAAFPPGPRTWYPTCPIYRWFGILCPGCGATRALAALLRRNLHEALRQNAFAVVLLPPAAAFGLNCFRRALRKQEFQWPRIPAWATASLTGLALAFTVARNLH